MSSGQRARLSDYRVATRCFTGLSVRTTIIRAMPPANLDATAYAA
jgi:hypothetical protein